MLLLHAMQHVDDKGDRLKNDVVLSWKLNTHTHKARLGKAPCYMQKNNTQRVDF